MKDKELRELLGIWNEVDLHDCGQCLKYFNIRDGLNKIDNIYKKLDNRDEILRLLARAIGKEVEYKQSQNIPAHYELVDLPKKKKK